MWFTGEQRVNEHTHIPREDSSSELEAPTEFPCVAIIFLKVTLSLPQHTISFYKVSGNVLSIRHMEDTWSRHTNPSSRILSCRAHSVLDLSPEGISWFLGYSGLLLEELRTKWFLSLLAWVILLWGVTNAAFASEVFCSAPPFLPTTCFFSQPLQQLTLHSPMTADCHRREPTSS